MRKILNKTLKVGIPYLSIKGSATLSKIREMNEIQSRILLMITSHEELGISSLTLGEAINQIFGLIPNNQPIIKKDILEIIESGTIKIDLGDEDIFDKKVMILNLRINRGVKDDILAKEKYSLITSNTRVVKKKIAVEMFDGFKVIENPVFIKQDDITINNSKKYTSAQFEDLIEQQIDVRENETLEKIILDDKMGTIGWILNDLNVEISDVVKPLDNNSERILELISSGNIGISPEFLINKEIDDLILKETRNTDLKIESLIDKSNLNDANEAIDTKYEIGQYGIKVFYEISFNTTLNGKEIKVKEIVSEDITYKKLFTKNGINFTPEILDSFNREAKEEIIKVIAEGAKVKDQTKKYLLNVLSIKLFKTIEVNELKKLISTKDLFSEYFESNVVKFKTDSSLIYKMFKMGYVSEEWLLKHTQFQYGKTRLFKEWNLEEKFFELINKYEEFVYEDKTKQNIENEIIFINKEIPGQFVNQSLYKNLIKKLNSKKVLSSEWSEDKILAEGARLRDRLESFVVSNSDNPSENNKIGEKARSTFKPKIARTISDAYKELSNFTSHNISKTSNLKKENIVKTNLIKLEKIFKTSIKELKLEVEEEKGDK